MKKLFIELIAAMLIICGCSPAEQKASTATPAPQETREISEAHALEYPQVQPVVFDDMWLDMDGDGVNEYAQLSSGSAKVTDGFCLEPVLTVFKNDQPIVMQALFGKAGYVKPYFGKPTDFDSDGREDIHVMYKANSVLQQQEFSIYGLLGNMLILLSPPDAYLASLYHVPTLFMKELTHIDFTSRSALYDARFNNIVTLITEATDQGEQRGPEGEPSYTNVRFDGPLQVSDIDDDGNNELLYTVTSYAENGDVSIYDAWIRQLQAESWGIVSYERVKSYHADVLPELSVYNSTLKIYSYSFPGTPLKSRDKNWFGSELTLLDHNKHRGYYSNINRYGERIAYDLEFSEILGDRLLSVTLSSGAITGAGLHPADSPIVAGVPLGQAKTYLGETPFYEDTTTLVYLRKPYTYSGTSVTPKTAGFEVLHFVDGKLDSVEFAVGTDYQIAASRCNGNFGEYKGGRLDNVVFYTICGYKTYLLEAYAESTCLYPPDFMDKGSSFYRAGKNIMAEYIDKTFFSADYNSLALVAPYGDPWTPTVVDYQEIPRFVYDYDGDGHDEILAETLSINYRLALYDIDLNGVYEINKSNVDTFCDTFKIYQLKDDMMKLLDREE